MPVSVGRDSLAIKSQQAIQRPKSLIQTSPILKFPHQSNLSVIQSFTHQKRRTSPSLHHTISIPLQSKSKIMSSSKLKKKKATVLSLKESDND